MQEKLIIFLHIHSLHPSWVVMDEQASIKQCIPHGHPEALTQVAVDKEIIVLVPSEDVLLTSTTLPKMNRTRLAQVLPYALEEQLTSDVDKLHFATNETPTDGHLPVAVVSIDKMQHWLTLLQSWQIEANVFTPTVLALPLGPAIWHVAINGGMALVRTGLYEGFECDKANLNQLLTIALSSKAEKTEQIFIHYYSQTEEMNTAENLNLTVGITLKEEFNNSLQYFSDLAHHIVKSPSLNLLQGPYRAKKSKLPQIDKMWRMTSYLALTWVVLLFMYPTVSYFILSQRLNSLENQIEQIYKRQFPEASSMVAPKSRMEEKWQKLAAQVGESKLLSLIGFVGQGMSQATSVKLNRLDFQNNQLTLELSASSSDDIAKLTDYLTHQSLEVKQENASLTGTRVSATLVIG